MLSVMGIAQENTMSNKQIKVLANLVYSPHGKYEHPIEIAVTCEVTQRGIWEGASLKEVNHGNFFIDRLGSGHAVKNENGNRGVSLSRFITGEPGRRPVDGNSLNVTLSNWRN